MTTREKRESTYNIKYVQVVCELNSYQFLIYTKVCSPSLSTHSGNCRCTVAG